MRNFGNAHTPYKNYGPPKHFRFHQKGDFETIPLYTAPSYGSQGYQLEDGSWFIPGKTPPTRGPAYSRSSVALPPPPEQSASDKAKGALAIGGIGLAIVGALTIMPLVVWPFVIKSFRPDLPYGRRVGIGLGISIGLAAVGGVARAAFGQKES